MKLHSLFSVIPKDEIDRVLQQEYCELDCEFLGFTDVYENLAKIIPLHFTVIDLGCCYAAQAYYFKNIKHI